MKTIKTFFILTGLIVFAAACSPRASLQSANVSTPSPEPSPPRTADSFAYPIGETEHSTQAKDTKDKWYNALDFGESNHLGEDWNKNSGANTDCGEPVYAAGNGRITYAGNAGPGWGNVLIVTHFLPDGQKIQTLYGHMREIIRAEGDVKKREQIGKIGGADGKYPCHLHFELRDESSRMWNQAGPGYSSDRKGWLDPSDFIDSERKK